MTDAKMTIQILKDGPLLVKEPCIVLNGETGKEMDIEKWPIALCRCGLSVNKPFCDGAHSKQGFDGTCSANVKP